MRGTESFFQAFHLSLRQRCGFGVFAGAAKLVDFGAEGCDIALLRQ
jgi:hypothetical protein